MKHTKGSILVFCLGLLALMSLLVVSSVRQSQAHAKLFNALSKQHARACEQDQQLIHALNFIQHHQLSIAQMIGENKSYTWISGIKHNAQFRQVPSKQCKNHSDGVCYEVDIQFRRANPKQTIGLKVISTLGTDTATRTRCDTNGRITPQGTQRCLLSIYPTFIQSD